MRIPHWQTLVYGLVLAATVGSQALAAPPGAGVSKLAQAGGSTIARGNDVDDVEDFEETEIAPSRPITGGGRAFTPVQYSGPGPQAAPGMGNPGAPPSAYDPGMAEANAWPQTTPFEMFSRQDTYNDGGLWMYKADEEFGYKNIIGLDYLYGNIKSPGNQFIGYWPDRSATFFPGNIGAFPTWQTTSWVPNQHLDGLKITLGREWEDGSGASLSGFTLFENSVDNYFSSFRGVQTDSSTIKAMFGIVVLSPNGTTTVLPFDSQLYQKYTQNVLGADADIWTTPFFQRDTFKLKFVWGAKYLKIHEDFYLNGLDSGLGYTVANSTGGGGGGGSATDPTTISGPFTVLQSPNSGSVPLGPYSTYLASSTTNNLIGPQIGIRYELGGEKFKLWGQTKIAVTADVQQSNLTSNNWNQLKAPSTTGTNVVTAGPDLINLTQVGVVTQNNTNTHIAPVFDTSLNGEFAVFELLPYVNQWQVFKSAKMRIGWNYVYVNEVSRASADINYLLHGPTINTNNRTSVGFSTVNFAVDWRF